MERDQLINLLKKNEAFGAAPADAIEDLVDAGEIRSIEAGTALLHQGATGESIWMLLSGTLEVPCVRHWGQSFRTSLCASDQKISP